MLRGSGTPAKAPARQADAVLSQANPVSTQLYEVLPETSNVELIGISANITWAVTQPTPLEVVVTIDGIPHVYIMANPVSATPYTPIQSMYDMANAAAAQRMGNAFSPSDVNPFPMQKRRVLVQIRVTWATTQPTPLVCRVKWAKW